MFFEALRRKNHSPLPSTIASIVPIHNAVNERAWSRILVDWEMRSPSAMAANAPCGGPRLRSFSGDSGKLTPRARWYGWLGYERPFDRHDWVVERCSGESIEYVIDFYRGKGGGVSFYLDVRPKLNSWAGWKMRLGKLVGL
jgi:cytochrome c heme-lyase